MQLDIASEETHTRFTRTDSELSGGCLWHTSRGIYVGVFWEVILI